MTKFYLLSAFLILIVSCRTGPDIQPENLDNLQTAAIDSLGSRYLELGRFSGVILVTKGDSVLYNNSFGMSNYGNNIPFSNRTSFKIGAVSELITAGIIRNLAQQGKLELGAPVNTYLPEIEGNYTVQDLLNHESPLQDLRTIQEAHPKMSFSAINYANLSEEKEVTGGRSDLGYHLLGLAIEKVSKKTFQEVVQEYSTRLGLENTYFEKEDDAAAVGYLYHNYRGEGLELQRSPTYDAKVAFSSTGLKSTAGDLAVILNHTQENAMDIQGYLEDDGFSYAVVKDPETDMNIIVLSNRRHPVAKEISHSISAIFQKEPYKVPLPRKPFSIDPDLLKDYAGTYALNEQMSLEVIQENDSLFVLMGPNKVHLIPQSANQFYMKERDASMRFLRDTDHKVQKAVLLDGFLEGNEIRRL